MTSYNLRTRKGNKVFDVDCLAYTFGSFYAASHLGLLSVNSRGFAAWRMTGNLLGPPGEIATPLSHVSCPAVSLCVADDDPGNILTATQPTGGRGAWTFTKPGASINDGPISCVSTDFCVIAGGGVSLSSMNPTGGASAWTVSPMPAGGVDGLSCASSSLCVAVGGDRILTSTDPTRATDAWTQTTLPGAQALGDVSCASNSMCVATDSQAGKIFVSTNPTGGASAWETVLTSTGSNPAGVSCPSITLCVVFATYTSGGAAYTAVYSSADPSGGASAWKKIILPGFVSTFGSGVSCAPGPLCVAVDEFGGMAISTNPTGAASAWQRTGFEFGTEGLDFRGVSCPSASLCVATTAWGRFAISTTPAAPASWRYHELVDAPECAFTTPCVTQQVYAYDSHGTRLLDSTPPGSATALDNLKLTGDLLTWTHNGMPRQAQLG